MGQKLPPKPREIWAIRFRLQLGHHTRDLALLNLGIDSKLRSCDLVALRVRDVAQGDRVAARAIVMQKKTHHPVKFEITEQTRDAVGAWLGEANLRPEQFLYLGPSLGVTAPHNSAVRQDSESMGEVNRARCDRIRHTHDAQDKADADLPAHPEPASGTTSPRAHETREYRPLSWHRGRQRVGDSRANRRLGNRWWWRPPPGGRPPSQALDVRAESSRCTGNNDRGCVKTTA